MFQTCENKDIDYLNNINNIHYNNEVSEFSEYVSDLITGLKDFLNEAMGNQVDALFDSVEKSFESCVNTQVNDLKAAANLIYSGDQGFVQLILAPLWILIYQVNQ